LLGEISQLPGVEFVVASVVRKKKTSHEFWGIEDPKPVSEWMDQVFTHFEALGETLQIGEIQQVLSTGPQRKTALAKCGETKLCVGFGAALPPEDLRDTMKTILNKWAS
jgi:hypothetical protein